MPVMRRFYPDSFPPVPLEESRPISRRVEEDPYDGSEVPDEDLVEVIGETIGVTYEESEPLRCGRKELERDRHRWELDPASAEDYRERMRTSGEPDRPAEPVLHMTHSGHRPGRKA